MVNADQLVKLLDFNLSSKNFNNAVKLIDDEEHGKVILAHYPDVIQQVILKHLTAENYVKEPTLYEVCEALLKLLAEKCHQEGILFEFLEIIETVKDDDVFTSILKCLQVIILKQSDKKSRSLEYCLNSIEDYILELPLPHELFKNVEEEEEKVLENDDQVRRVLVMYITLDLFYEPIVNHIVENTQVDRGFRSNKFNRRNVLFCFILRLLGKPLSFLDLSHDGDSSKSVTYSRQVAETMVKTMSKLHANFFQLLSYVETRCRWPCKDKLDDDLVDIFLHHEKTPLVQMGMLFYLVIAEGIAIETVPKIYNPVYIFQMGIYSVNTMISSDDAIIFKGLRLGLKLLENISTELSSDELDLDIHRIFCNNLVKILMYSPSKRNRQTGLSVLKNYILKFDGQGRFLLIKNILRISNHKGLMGYLTTLYKDLVLAELNLVEMSEFTSGNCLKELLSDHLCNLTGGAQCDIADSSDQIISSLNFLYALIIRDKQNASGIKDLVPALKDSFLGDLRSALDLSRAHYQAEIENVKSGKSVNLDDFLKDAEIINDMEPLDDLTNERKLEMLHSALSMFDLIEYHLASYAQWHRAIKAVAIGTNDAQKLLSTPSSHAISRRKLTVPSMILLHDKKLEDFRAREEQKEAEFNKQPAVEEETKEKEQPEEDEAVTEIKNKILEASLAFVDSQGWTRQAIVKGAEQAGFPGTVHGMFPKGGIELINFYYLKCNRDLVEQMRQTVGENSEKVREPKEFVCWAIKQRLEMLHPYIKSWPQALAIMTLPPNVPKSLANMLTLVDDICYYSGDRSVDFNWYARRIGLATIYKATELFILQDSSPNYESTWKFLERRIADAALVHDVLVQSEDATKNLTSAVSSVFSTARNILGINFDRR